MTNKTRKTKNVSERAHNRPAANRAFSTTKIIHYSLNGRSTNAAQRVVPQYSIWAFKIKLTAAVNQLQRFRVVGMENDDKTSFLFLKGNYTDCCCSTEHRIRQRNKFKLNGGKKNKKKYGRINRKRKNRPNSDHEIIICVYQPMGGEFAVSCGGGDDDNERAREIKVNTFYNDTRTTLYQQHRRTISRANK